MDTLRYNIINFEKNRIIVVIDDDNILWFNAKQVSSALDYKQAKLAIINNVDKEDKIQLKKMNINFEIKQHPDSVYINESGLYSILIASKTNKSKKFIKWLTSDVLPKLRQNNVFSPDENITKLLKKISELEEKNKILQNDLKLEKFPDGAMVYITEEIDTDGEIYYRLGKTDNINKRIKIHNSHTIHNKKVVYFTEVQCPLQLETCIRSMLYNYRIKNRKDYYKTTLTKIKKAFEKCLESMKCVNEQSGGTDQNTFIITYFQDKLNKIYNIITIANID